MTSVNVYTSIINLIQPFSDAEKGRLFDAILTYAQTEKDVEISGNERFIWQTIKEEIDKQIHISKVRSDAGKRSGEQRRTNANKTEQTGTKLNKREQTRTNANKTEQTGTKLNKREQTRTNANKTEQTGTKLNKREQTRTNANKTEQNPPEEKKENFPPYNPPLKEKKEIPPYITSKLSSYLTCGDEENFEKFWEAYPRKNNKVAARQEFAKVSDVPIETLLNAIAKQKHSTQWTDNNGQYIPYPATWLRQKRWNDEVTEIKTPKPVVNPNAPRKPKTEAQTISEYAQKIKDYTARKREVGANADIDNRSPQLSESARN